MPNRFELGHEIGLSTYLIGKSSAESIIFETSHKNLSIVPSGPIPPNPSELCSSDKALRFFENQKKKFDFIIVDTAPIGTVSDGYGLAAISDANLIVVRHGKTNKNYLSAVLSDVQENGISAISIIVNDFVSSGGSYRYAYNYRYEQKKGIGKLKLRMNGGKS